MPTGASKATYPQLTGERFKWVLFISIFIHVVIVLGVTFVLPSSNPLQNFAPPLKITLVTTQSDQINEDATTLAQTNSEGEEIPNTLPAASQIAKASQQQLASETAIKKENQLLAEQSKARHQTDLDSTDQADNSQSLESRESLTNSINLAYLNANAQPRERFVSADAKASEVAPYLEKWRLLIERVGNLNYPDAAKQLSIEGSLVMDVILNKDGSVREINILRSSGEKILDDGAERIVHIAAPFDPFTEEMERNFDVLHIIRTWKFSHNKLVDITN